MEYTIARCPYCGYVWHVRLVGTLPKSCPRNKRRFFNPNIPSPNYATGEVEIRRVAFQRYGEFRVWLDVANVASLDCENIDDVIEKTLK